MENVFLGDLRPNEMYDLKVNKKRCALILQKNTFEQTTSRSKVSMALPAWM